MTRFLKNFFNTFPENFLSPRQFLGGVLTLERDTVNFPDNLYKHRLRSVNSVHPCFDQPWVLNGAVLSPPFVILCLLFDIFLNSQFFEVVVSQRTHHKLYMYEYDIKGTIYYLSVKFPDQGFSYLMNKITFKCDNDAKFYATLGQLREI